MRLQVLSPYHKGFVAGAKRLEGRWRPESKVWTFPVENRRGLALLIQASYGQQSVPRGMQSLMSEEL